MKILHSETAEMWLIVGDDGHVLAGSVDENPPEVEEVDGEIAVCVHCGKALVDYGVVLSGWNGVGCLEGLYHCNGYAPEPDDDVCTSCFTVHQGDSDVVE